MKKLFILLGVILGVSTVSAQKFARVNLQEVVVAMPEFEQAQKNLEAFGKDLQEQMEQIQVEFNNKLADFQKNQATMAASVKQMRQQELEQLQQRFSEFQQIAQQDFQKKEAELLEPVQKKANDAVNKVAKAAGYIAVFNTAVPSLAYFDEAQLTDIAALVKKELGIVEKPAAK
ncbi:MAG: OmpH family outer membrane protein [Alistipes sp.]|nr:OmpH family outer membrane protein [Alistipes sp.]MBQ3027021.1 OmpH family outer membrane protein [Alistipes sp.]